MKKDFYQNYYYRYLTATPDARQAARDHWTKCHIENVKADRNDLIIFSGKILAAIYQTEKDAKTA